MPNHKNRSSSIVVNGTCWEEQIEEHCGTNLTNTTHSS